MMWIHGGSWRSRCLAACVAVVLSSCSGSSSPSGPGGGGNSDSIKTSSISQYGVTWTFSGEVTAGKFVTGDWWVVGPVTILTIDPPSAAIGGRTKNGSMINPQVKGWDQGYDSSMYKSYAPNAYKPGLNAALDVSKSKPLTLQPGASLISTISVNGAEETPQLKSAAVLTCLATIPPAGSFRPPYAGNAKPLHNVAMLDFTQLRRLAPVASTPTLAEVEGYFERPWIDHIPDFVGRDAHPADNMPDYGREMADEIGTAALMLHLDFTDEQKTKLLIRFVQLGIDLYGVYKAGGSWSPDGGHASGRKWPILFAGLVLDHAEMRDIGSQAVAFGEDDQTFFVEETSKGVYNFGYGGYTKDDVGLPEWGNSHASDPTHDNKSWTADSYRTCCTANSWVGFVLAARIMSVQALWKHAPLFDYMDRYMAKEPHHSWTRSWSVFPEDMWDKYR